MIYSDWISSSQFFQGVKHDEKKKSILIGGLLVALVAPFLAGTGGSRVYAQSPSQKPLHALGHGRGPDGNLSLAALQIAEQKLGMTTAELITALQGSKTLEQIAQEKGIDYSSIQTAIQQQSQTDLRTHIQQAVTNGAITQEKASWLLEGVDKDLIGNGPDSGSLLGGIHGFGFGPDMAPQVQPAPTQQSAQ
jgi:hypothetical protein